MRFRHACLVVASVAGLATVGAAKPSSAGTAACQPAPTITAAPTVATPGGFHAVAPIRLLDTRQSSVKTGPGCVMVLDVGANASIPDGAEALALNVTVVDAPTRGFVTAYPCGSNRPDASNVNPRVANATANSVLVQLDETRQVCFYTHTSLHLIVDMTGWFGRFGDSFHVADSSRLLDTRVSRPDGGTGLVAPGTELRLAVAGQAVPAEATAVAINVTVTDATAFGFVTVYPCSSGRPLTSTVNFLASEQRANHVVAGLDPSGAICLWNDAPVHVIVDLEGWFGGEPGSGTTFRPLLGSRVLDTRSGTGGVTGIVAANTTVSFDPSNGARLPLGSTVALNVVATEAAERGFVTIYPCVIGQPSTSVVNAEVGTEATNVAFVEVSGDSKVCLFVSAAMHVVVDVIGTFGPGGPLQQLSLGQFSLGQTFAPDAHDYTTRCAAGTNTMTVHAVGAPGATVSVALSTAPAPSSSAAVVDQTITLSEDDAFVVRAGGPGVVPEEYWVRCLPHDFPVLQVTRTETPSAGWYLTENAFSTAVSPPSPVRFLMILDNRSVPVWYRRVASPTIDLTRMSDGTLAWTKLLGLAFGSTPDGAYEVHRLDGSLVRPIASVEGPTDHHDIVELPNGDVLLATYVPRDHVDLTELGPAFDDDELVYDNVIEQIRPDGTVVWSWNSEDHIAISETTFPLRFPGIDGIGVDLVHLNSISVAPDGDVVISARHTDAVYKIRRDAAGSVVRIGGNESDVTFVGDPLNGFARQHDAQILPDGHLRLFDNRTATGKPRAVEYALDLAQMTATLEWSLTDPGVNVSGGVGAVRSLGDGDTVVTWGGSAKPAFTEHGPDGELLQSTTMVGHYPYRVDKQPLDAFDIDDLRATAGL